MPEQLLEEQQLEIGFVAVGKRDTTRCFNDPAK